jgi:hypothetical protein
MAGCKLWTFVAIIMKYLYYSLFLSTIIIGSSCSTNKCPKNFNLTAKDSLLIPYLKYNILVYKNEENVTDTFYIISREKSLTDYHDPIETGGQHYLELNINYTNKRFTNASRYDMTLLTVKKQCLSGELFMASSWIDYHYGLQFDRNTGYIDSYPDTIYNFIMDDKTFPVILAFQTDTIKYPDAIEKEIKTVYWLPGTGVVKYESRYSGWWTRIQ